VYALAYRKHGMKVDNFTTRSGTEKMSVHTDCALGDKNVGMKMGRFKVLIFTGQQDTARSR
jgi:hypothetical protein